MIALQIITKNTETAHKISDYLLKNDLILEALIMDNIISKEILAGDIITKSKVQITGITKALLFDKINAELSSNFDKTLYTLHSVPIVYMDWDRQNKLLQQVENI